MEKGPVDYLRGLNYDTVAHTSEALSYLSDWSAATAQILGGNAKRLLGL